MVPTLRDLAIRSAIKHIDGITDVGGMSYELVRPILRKIRNVEQLRLIEQNSPHLAGIENGELWRAFIKRDIKQWETRQIEPKNPAKWARIYLKLKREDDVAEEQAREALNASLRVRAQERQKKQAVIRSDIVQPTTARRRTAGAGNSSTSTPAPSRNAGSFLASLKKQKQTPRAPLPMSTIHRPLVHKTNPVAPGKVAAAPINMVLEHQRKSNLIAPRAGFPNRKIDDAVRLDHVAKEDRLRALTGAKAVPVHTSMTGTGRTIPTNAPIASTIASSESIAKATVIPAPLKPAIIRKRPATNCFMTSNKKIKR